MTAWQDDYTTADERRDALSAARDARMHRQALQRSAPPEARYTPVPGVDRRHVGTDDGRHHWNTYTTPPRPSAHCPCGCQQAGSAADDSADPLDVLGRQVDSYLDRYERAQIMAGIERRAAELAMMRVRFSVVDD